MIWNTLFCCCTGQEECKLRHSRLNRMSAKKENEIILCVTEKARNLKQKRSVFWRVNVLYFVGIGSQPQKKWQHWETGTEPQKTWRHATIMAETENNYCYGNGNMTGQTTTWPLCNQVHITYQTTLTRQIVKLWSAWLKLFFFFKLILVCVVCVYIYYSMERGPSWGSNRFSSSQKINCILLNRKVH